MAWFKKKYHIGESFGNLETHEVFLDTLAHVKEEELGISEKRFEVAIKTKIIVAIFGLFLLSAGVLFSKTFFLQAVDGADLYVAAQRNKGRLTMITPERGIIYDSNGKKLVLNSPAYDLLCLPAGKQAASVERLSGEITIIASVLGKDMAELEKLFAENEDVGVVVAENLGQEMVLVLEARKAELPDCTIQKNTIRNYAYGPVFSHVLGYTGKINREELKSSVNYTAADYFGKTGIEKQYEQALRGTPGTLEVLKTATGIKKGNEVLSEPETGDSLVLNIDAGLQQAAYSALEKSIKNIKAKRGAAVALDPRTGAVLASVSYPAYDNNIFSKGISQADFNALNADTNQPFFNRAIAAQYPTGSTIKPFLASAALQEGIISPTKIINDPGYILVQSQNDPSVSYRFGGVTPHGNVDMREALAVSSNIYFYTIGGGHGGQQGLGPTRIKKYLGMYGWEQKTGIDLPGEFAGFVPSPEWKKERKNEQWWDGDTYNLSIGQSDLQVTPLQVAVAYSAIANGGTLHKPQVVQKVISSADQSVVQEFAPKIAGQLGIDQKNLQVVREGMRDGVLYGSSVFLNSLPVDVAGKTGTVETNKDGVFNTWSSNFAPYDNPEIVFVATIEGVEGLQSATLPVARDVLQYYFSENRK